MNHSLLNHKENMPYPYENTYCTEVRNLSIIKSNTGNELCNSFGYVSSGVHGSRLHNYSRCCSFHGWASFLPDDTIKIAFAVIYYVNKL